jgi:hypothetical protein
VGQNRDIFVNQKTDVAAYSQVMPGELNDHRLKGGGLEKRLKVAIAA